MQAHKQSLNERAKALWKADGSPPGKIDDYVERARELIAIETNGDIARIPVSKLPDPKSQPFGQPVEPLEAVRNQGDFPTLTDQGEEQLFPEKAEDDAESAKRH